MKRVLTIAALLCVGLLFSECKKEDIDLCENITCFNGGTCINGGCSCPSGYSGPACETYICDGIVCFNGGTCINGECSCPSGFTGPACESQITPSRIIIKSNSMEFTSYPIVSNGGGGWDPSSGADPYFYVQDVTTNERLYTLGSHLTNVTTPTINFNHPSITLDNVQNRFAVGLFDDDGLGADDFMGGLEFSVYFDTGGFPSNINIFFGDFAFNFDVQYQF